MSESYNLEGGNPTYFNSLLLGSDPKSIDKLTESDNFDASKMTVKLEINGVEVRICDFNDVLDKWSDDIESQIKEKLEYMSKEKSVIENAQILLKEKMGNALEILNDIENSSWKLED